MSLFKERQQTSKRIIALENQVLALKQELVNKSVPQVSIPKDCTECQNEKVIFKEQSKELKLELKKVKSDCTRSKNKIIKLQNELNNLKSEE
jgi:chromosome segregation ATPase